MASLNLGHDVAKKRERKQTAAHIVAKSYPLWQAIIMRRYGSLSNINPCGRIQLPFYCHFRQKQLRKKVASVSVLKQHKKTFDL